MRHEELSIGDRLISAAVIAAAGSSQSDATELNRQFTYVSGADGTKGVKLGVSSNRYRVIVNGSAVSGLKVYPKSGSQINALSANAAFILGPGQEATFIGVSDVLWYVGNSEALAAVIAELDLLDGANDANDVASKAVVLDSSGNLILPGRLEQNGDVLAVEAGDGITDGANTIYRSSVEKVGGIIKTRILIDLTDLRSTGADDIIGDDGTAENCHIGQITAAVNGTILGGRITCLEAPTGGDPDIDLYANVEATGSESDDPSGLSGTGILVDSGDHTLGSVKVLAAVPAPDEYLYLVAGAATDADYTAGKLLIELEGY